MELIPGLLEDRKVTGAFLDAGRGTLRLLLADPHFGYADVRALSDGVRTARIAHLSGIARLVGREVSCAEWRDLGRVAGALGRWDELGLLLLDAGETIVEFRCGAPSVVAMNGPYVHVSLHEGEPDLGGYVRATDF